MFKDSKWNCEYLVPLSLLDQRSESHSGGHREVAEIDKMLQSAERYHRESNLGTAA